MGEKRIQNKYDAFVPSAWDNKHIISTTGGIKLKKDWEFGMKFRFSGGSPYTPYDTLTSSYTYIWDINSFWCF